MTVAKDIVNAKAYLQRLAANMAAVNFAPEQPTDASLKFPYVESWVNHVEHRRFTGSLASELYTIRTRVHVKRFNMGDDVSVVDDMMRDFPRVLTDTDNITLGGYVDTVVCGPDSPVIGDVLTIQTATAQTLCAQFDTIVKITTS